MCPEERGVLRHPGGLVIERLTLTRLQKSLRPGDSSIELANSREVASGLSLRSMSPDFVRSGNRDTFKGRIHQRELVTLFVDAAWLLSVQYQVASRILLTLAIVAVNTFRLSATRKAVRMVSLWSTCLEIFRSGNSITTSPRVLLKPDQTSSHPPREPSAHQDQASDPTTCILPSSYGDIPAYPSSPQNPARRKHLPSPPRSRTAAAADLPAATGPSKC